MVSSERPLCFISPFHVQNTTPNEYQMTIAARPVKEKSAMFFINCMRAQLVLRLSSPFLAYTIKEYIYKVTCDGGERETYIITNKQTNKTTYHCPPAASSLCLFVPNCLCHYFYIHTKFSSLKKKKKKKKRPARLVTEVPSVMFSTVSTCLPPILYSDSVPLKNTSFLYRAGCKMVTTCDRKSLRWAHKV